jgi:hypothetical protein
MGKGDPRRVDAVVGGRVQHERPPAAADVQEPLACGQTQLPADQIELALLRLFEAVAPIAEVRARIDHAGAEQQAVEVVRNVIVMPDRGSVPNKRVPAPAQRRLDLGRRWSAQDAETRHPHRRQSQSKAIAKREPRAGELMPCGEHVLERAVHGERAVNPRAREPDLARLAHHVRERLRRDDDNRSVLRHGLVAQRAAVPEPHADR